nr:single-stranded DNA-binding protein [uncultured Porphyromonas sp.]
MAQLPPTNQVILTGEVTEEPTIHYLAPDFPEVHLRLKTEEQVTGREGGKSYTQRLWHRIVARGSTGMLLEQAHEGSILSIAGRIEYVREVDRAGTSTLVTEIVATHARIHQQASRGATPTASTPASPTFDATAYPPAEDEDPLS